ncbi:MAG TPA: hypothetical protein DE060_09555 [Lentisphaeria bacterium]|nr:hypothetical protein [Lentisphaeria bacterium]
MLSEISIKSQWITNRLSVITNRTYSEMKQTLSDSILSNMFFTWDGISDELLLKYFRACVDDYLKGGIGRDECRNRMRRFAREHGLDDGSDALTNIASTARLNLIIDQNAKMAKAVETYERMYSPGHLEAFPYVMYCGTYCNVRLHGHRRYDGMIFDKNDPILQFIWPPSELECDCRLEDCSRKKAEKLGASVTMFSKEGINHLSRGEIIFNPFATIVSKDDKIRAKTTAEILEEVKQLNEY